MHAVNTPLRDYKQTNYEGGIRTPFVLSWPARYKGGREIHTPVISLDILPTVLDAADIELPADVLFDGKSILPLLEGKKDVLHRYLFWSEGGGSGEWAVRSGDWKLVVHKDRYELFDLGKDVSESTDLSVQHQDVVKKLKALYDEWLEEMAEPLKEPGKRWVPEPVAFGRDPAPRIIP
jgi:arylsulfatase A-like enzyme